MSQASVLREAIRIASRLGTAESDRAEVALAALSAVPGSDISYSDVASLLDIPLGVLDFFVCCAEEFDRTRRGADSGYSTERIAELARILGEESPGLTPASNPRGAPAAR